MDSRTLIHNVNIYLSVSAAARRASEGGANIHWGAKGTMKWDKDASSEVVNKFRNYEI